MTSRLAIITTHPVQYHSCWYGALALRQDIRTEVFFCHRSTPRDQAASGFNVQFEWDSRLLDGFSYTFLRNTADNPSPSTFQGTNTPELGKILRRDRFDAVLISGWYYRSAWQAILSAWRSGIPVLVRSDSHLHTPRSGLKVLMKEFVYPCAISRFDGCLAVGTWSRDYFLHYDADPQKVFTVPYSVDPGVFSGPGEAMNLRRRDWRERFKLSENVCVFLFSGKFVSVKRPLDFVAALARAHQSGARVAGVMVGDGELRSACQAMAADKPAPIFFTGFLNQTEIANAYAGCDVLVVPSDSETWGLVVNEAMVSGKPCIVTDRVGAGPDLIDPGITGDIFPSGSVAALSKLMEDYSYNLIRTRLMATAVLRRIVNFSPDVAAEATSRAVQAVLHQ